MDVGRPMIAIVVVRGVAALSPLVEGAGVHRWTGRSRGSETPSLTKNSLISLYRWDTSSAVRTTDSAQFRHSALEEAVKPRGWGGRLAMTTPRARRGAQSWIRDGYKRSTCGCRPSGGSDRTSGSRRGSRRTR